MVRYYHWVWTIILYGWISIYISRIALTPALPLIMNELNLNYAQGGFLASSFFFAYTSMQPLAGYLGDRFGRKLILSLGGLIWTLSTFLISLSNSFWQIFFLRLLTGIGQGTYFSNDRSLIAHYTPKDKLGLGLGLSFTGLGLGFGISVIFGGFLAELLGWRNLFLIYSIPSLVTIILFLSLIKEPSKKDYNSKTQSLSKWILLKDKNLWIIYLAGISPIYTQWVLATWAPIMFLELGEKDLGLASAYTSVFGFSIFGMALSGSLSDRVMQRGKGRKYVTLLYMSLLVIMLFFLTLILSFKWPLWTLIIGIFFTGFFMWGCWSPIFAYLAERVPSELRGLAYGLLNAFNFIGSVIAPWSTGLIRDLTGSFIHGLSFSALLVIVSLFLVSRLSNSTNLREVN
ncbi:MAG: MFS transporter [Nitrososphaerales archaeon]